VLRKRTPTADRLEYVEDRGTVASNGISAWHYPTKIAAELSRANGMGGALLTKASVSPIEQATFVDH